MSFCRTLAWAVVATAAAVVAAPAQTGYQERLQQANEDVRELRARLQDRNARVLELEQEIEQLQDRLERAEDGGAVTANERRGGGMREPNPNEACFYAYGTFEGEFFCAKRGNGDASLTNEGWSDRISSFRLGAEARVLVCEHPDLLGHCIGVDRSLESLPREWDNAVSSYLVR